MDFESTMYAILNELQFNYYTPNLELETEKILSEAMDEEDKSNSVDELKREITECNQRTSEDSRVFVLSGNVEKIKEFVIKPLANRIATDKYKPMDLDFCELIANNITKESSRTFPAPKGKHGGVLVISDLLDFVKTYNINEQIRLIRDILGNGDGNCGHRSGWAIVFLTKEIDDKKWWSHSFCPYFKKKSMLINILVE